MVFAKASNRQMTLSVTQGHQKMHYSTNLQQNKINAAANI